MTQYQTTGYLYEKILHIHIPKNSGRSFGDLLLNEKLTNKKFTQKTKEIVGELYKDNIEYFKYNF
jgi:hypothetical protein